MLVTPQQTLRTGRQFKQHSIKPILTPFTLKNNQIPENNWLSKAHRGWQERIRTFPTDFVFDSPNTSQEMLYPSRRMVWDEGGVAKGSRWATLKKEYNL